MQSRALMMKHLSVAVDEGGLVAGQRIVQRHTYHALAVARLRAGQRKVYETQDSHVLRRMALVCRGL